MGLLSVVALSIACILVGSYVSRGWFNPLTVFSVIWGGITSLYQLRLSDHQDELSDGTYLVLLVVLASFAVFYLIGWHFRIKRKPTTRNYSRSYRGLFYFWLVGSFFEVAYCGGVPALWLLTGVGKTYMNYGVPTFHGFMNASAIAVSTIAFYRLLSIRKGDTTSTVLLEKQRAVVVIAIVVCYYLLIISRQVLISIAIQCVVLYVIRAKLKPKHVALVALFGVAGVFVFGFIGDMRTGYESFVLVSAIDPSLPQFFSGFYWVYMYLTMTLANVNNLVFMNVDPVGVAPAISGVVPSVVRDAIFGESTAQVQSFIVAQNFIVSGYFAYWYYGAGLPGVAVISGLYGLVGGVTCRRFMQLRDDRSALMYCIALQIVALSFFTNMLFYLPNVFQFAILAWFFAPAARSSKGIRLAVSRSNAGNLRKIWLLGV